MAKEAVDIDDPSTWPDDTAELAELADDMPDDRAGVEKPATEEDKPSATKEPETPEAEKASDEPDTTAAAGDKADQEETPDGVLAKDGKNVLPFNVLQKEREKSHAQAERIAELEAEAAKLETGDGEEKKPESDDTTNVDAAPLDDVDKEVARLNKLAESVLEEYGDENLAEQFRTQAKMVERQATLDSRLNNWEKSQKQNAQKTEQEEIQGALDSSPKLSGWAASEDQTFHERATALHAYLMSTDPAYKAKSWDERFKELPDRVESLHGDGPGKVDKTEKVVDIEKAKQDAGKKAPTSISDIQGGEAPIGSDMEELEGMSPSSITQKMMDFKSEDDMEAYVRGLS